MSKKNLKCILKIHCFLTTTKKYNLIKMSFSCLFQHIVLYLLKNIFANNIISTNKKAVLIYIDGQNKIL